MINKLISVFFTKKMLYSAVRHVLSGILAALTAKGLIEGSSTDEMLLGLASGLTALIWSAWEKYRDRQKHAANTDAIVANLQATLEKKDAELKQAKSTPWIPPTPAPRSANR